MGGSFWKTQPVDRGQSKGIIDSSKRVRKTPTALPEGMCWRAIDDIPKITSFLEEFYVEDITSSYRLLYSEDFFRFLFQFPKHKPEYSMCLLHNGKMIGYIMAREHTLVLGASTFEIVSANFLCLDKQYRSQGLAPLMIQEMRRVANLNGIFQAVFTAEKDYGFSVAKASYYHYPLSMKNLLDSDIIDYCHTVPKVPASRSSTRLATEIDMPDVHRIYQSSCKKFLLHEELDFETFCYNFASRENVIYTVYNEREQEFASFFIVGTRCVQKNLTIRRAYLYYWSGSPEIVLDAISIASSMSVDMFDMLDIADNRDLIGKLSLTEGTGTLRYHLYNIKESTIPSHQLNFILF